MQFDVASVREEFPSLALLDDGQPRRYFDNPGGTQVSRRVLRRVQDYLLRSNANSGGVFRTSQETDAVLAEAHQAMADLLNAPSPREVIFGPNMTSLTFALSRSLARQFAPGEEIVVTRMDHDANIAPWLHVAAERGLGVRWLSFDPHTYRYDLDELEMLLSERTKLVAVNYASNALGTVNDVQAIAERVHARGGLVFVDAVQYVPHGPTDVQALGCDLLVCSAYKFFGPHQGILWGRETLLESLPAYKVRPASETLPHRFETGTQAHEAQAGTLGAVEYLDWLGTTLAVDYTPAFAHLRGRRQRLHAAMAAIAGYERTLSTRLIEGLQQRPDVTIHGITDPARYSERVPTVAFTLEGHHPDDIARRLAEANVFVWSGHYYAVEVVRQLGLEERGGMVRIGLAHYNTAEEVDFLLEVLESLPPRR